MQIISSSVERSCFGSLAYLILILIFTRSVTGYWSDFGPIVVAELAGLLSHSAADKQTCVAEGICKYLLDKCRGRKNCPSMSTGPTLGLEAAATAHMTSSGLVQWSAVKKHTVMKVHETQYLCGLSIMSRAGTMVRLLLEQGQCCACYRH